MSMQSGPFRKIFKFYNSERREQGGMIETVCSTPYPSGVEYSHQLDFTDANLQTFTLDGNAHDSELTAGEITILSLANGCNLKMKYYVDSTEAPTIKVYAKRGWYDQNDVLTDNENYKESDYSAISIYTYGWQQQGVNAKIYFTPPSYTWKVGQTQGDVLQMGDPATDFCTLGVLYGYANQTFYTPIELRGKINFEDNNYYQAYYNWPGGIIDKDDDLDDFMSYLKNGGDGTPISPILPSEDPSQPGGGDIANPDYNPFSDPVDFPGLPTGGSAIASGFIRVYNPTSGQLQSLASKLWGNDFINTIHKIMNDPMEAMISLHSVPFQIVGGGNANIEVGNFDTEVSAKTVTTQYYTLDCGNISLPEHWASALDYSPYTTVDIFIPFVGVRPLQIDDVMGRVLNLKYNIDVLTGCAIAMLKCGDSVLYTYNTQVHTEIPYTMSSYGRLVQSIIGVAGTAIGATAGGAGALIGASIGGALGTAMTKHSDISRGGSLGGAVGVMGDFTPYLIIHRPIQSLASDFASKKGYPSNISAPLSSVHGYTVVDKIHLTGIDCTDTERDEIHALLKEGVII